MKIMAIDYGDAHTGIAISDATGTLAGFTTVIDSRKAEVVVQEILRLLPEHGVTELVLGYPKNMDGTVGPRAEKAAAFAETLRQAAAAGGDHRPAGGPVGRAAHHGGCPQHPI